MNEKITSNPLGTEPVQKLLRQFAVPSIIAMLVSALYNIVDQFFIGRSVGELGNAATNISFPLSISCIAIALLFGIGGASADHGTGREGRCRLLRRKRLRHAVWLRRFALHFYSAVSGSDAYCFRDTG